MYQVDDKPIGEPIETIHLYVVREGQERPSILPVLISVLTLLFLIAIGVLTPYQQPEQRASIRVPAVLLPLQTFRTSVAVIPTGVKTYSATTAHGTLTITNGSILSEELPQGMIFTGKDGNEVVTDAAVFVPAGSASGYGVVVVSAHAARNGKHGNVPVLDIDTVEGASIYIRNLQPFSGGQDAYTVRYITFQDTQNALAKARATLLQQTVFGLLQSSCQETIRGSQMLSVSWTCQFVSYSVPKLPGVKVLHAEVSGKAVVVEIIYLLRPVRIEGK